MDYVLKYFFNTIFIQIFSGFLAKQSIKLATHFILSLFFITLRLEILKNLFNNLWTTS